MDTFIRRVLMLIATLLLFAQGEQASAQEKVGQQPLQIFDMSYQQTEDFIFDTYPKYVRGQYYKEIIDIKDCVVYYKESNSKGVESTGQENFKDMIAIDADPEPSLNRYVIVEKFKNGGKHHYYFTDVYVCRDIYDAFQHMRQLCGAEGEPFD